MAPPKMDVDGPSPPKTKRKATKGGSDSEDEADSDVEMLDVDFTFFDPQPHDYHSIKLLLSQLLSHDAKLLDLGGVANLVLEQKLVGSTVKTDGAEGDPYAVLTVLNLNVHKDNPCIASLITYILSKTATNSDLHETLTALFALPVSAPKHVGLVLSERLVNMPAQVVPPMFRMLEEELQWARDEREPYEFSSLLFLSRVFLSSTDEMEEDPNAALNATAAASAGGKKNKKKKAKAVHEQAKSDEQVWMYHAEDEFIARSATHTHVFKFTSSPTADAEGRQADSFGVETRGQVMLVPWSKFGEVVTGLEGFLGGME